MERLRVRARLAQIAEVNSREYLQRFRRDKEHHSYTVEADLRSIWLYKKRVADELVAKWREEELIIGFAELERQRAAEGRAVAAESGKKGGKRKKKPSVRKRTSKKGSISALQKSLTSLSGGKYRFQLACFIKTGGS